MGQKQIKKHKRHYVWNLRLIFHSDKTDKDLWEEDLRPIWTGLANYSGFNDIYVIMFYLILILIELSGINSA
jgi:hypothetical protein